MIVEHPRTLFWKKLAAHGFLIAFVALMFFPFLIVFSISLRPGNFSTGSLIPDPISFEHWVLALGIPFTTPSGQVLQPPFPVMLWLWNSVKISAIASAGILLLSMTAAYAFSRLRFAGRGPILDVLLILQMFPAALTVIALYTIFDALGNITPLLAVDSHWSLILAYLMGIVLHIWTIKGYFDSIDPAMDKAAQIDGATPWQTFRYVFLPMSVPILAIVFVLAFIGHINEYPVASVLLRETNNMTLAVGARSYLYEQRYLWGDFAAAAILSGFPITLVFLAAQRYLVSGLTEGGVKG
jgi:maltose/maltodextrin transport system permease protein